MDVVKFMTDEGSITIRKDAIIATRTMDENTTEIELNTGTKHLVKSSKKEVDNIYSNESIYNDPNVKFVC